MLVRLCCLASMLVMVQETAPKRQCEKPSRDLSSAAVSLGASSDKASCLGCNYDARPAKSPSNLHYAATACICQTSCHSAALDACELHPTDQCWARSQRDSANCARAGYSLYCSQRQAPVAGKCHFQATTASTLSSGNTFSKSRGAGNHLQQSWRPEMLARKLEQTSYLRLYSDMLPYCPHARFGRQEV